MGKLAGTVIDDLVLKDLEIEQAERYFGECARKSGHLQRYHSICQQDTYCCRNAREHRSQPQAPERRSL